MLTATDVGWALPTLLLRWVCDPQSVLARPNNASGEEPPVVSIGKGYGWGYVCGLAISDWGGGVV
jgi:hypothetical protein